MKVIDKYLDKGLTGKPLGKVKGIVIHWFASPMAKAENVIKYWERQANGVNAHDVIDLDGTLYHAVPYNMMAYQVGCPRGYTKEAVKRLSSYPNRDVVGIECAHIDMTGKMTDETYNTLVEHSANLLKKFNLTTDDLWLHSEIVGKDYKDCHRFFTTTNPPAWGKFKNEVGEFMGGKKVVAKVASTVKDTNISKTQLTYTRTLKSGISGNDVKVLQSALTKLGYKCTTDGVFGNGTESQVKKFQKDNKLAVDGIVGKASINAINNQLDR